MLPHPHSETYGEGGVFSGHPEEALRGRNQFCLCGEKEENLGTAALKEQNFKKGAKECGE